ncbi:prepilin-type N-terminal cleavage/methylation domain-containing protein [Massilia sp. W12]|uniref:type II secretion system protein n=1 Tax=Massilia sp. W12 TaxID=3126507 RepID=UPI0030CB7943
MPKQMKHKTRARRAFTLIELLVVMAIIGLLLALALPRYYASVERARETALKENLQILRISIERFYADRGRYPENLQELVSAKYLRALPLDPITESQQSWTPVLSQEIDLPGVADVRSGAAGATQDGTPYEQL